MIRCALDPSPTFFREVLRYTAGALVVVPGLGKLLTYRQSVAFFAALDIPHAELAVLAVGALELVAAAALFLDRHAVLAGLSLVPVMAVAAATAGPTWQNLGVLAAGLLLPVAHHGERATDRD